MVGLVSITSALPLALSLVGLAQAWTTEEMRSKSVYQVITDRFATTDGSTTTACDVYAMSYCGGTWAGLTGKLDYIKGMGFDAIWISPVVANIGGNTTEGESYHGYWSQNINELNTAFGSSDDLKTLVSTAKGKGIGIMVDVVANHVAATSSGDFVPNTDYGPFNATSYYHRPFCWVDDYSNQTNVEQCTLGDTVVTLQDLNTEDTTVISALNTWVASLTATYGFEAIRIDTVKHIRKDFWPDFVSAAGVFAVGEVLDGDVAYVAAYQAQSMDSVFNYPVYYPLIDAFATTSGNLTALSVMVANVSSTFNDSTLLGNFLDNHDNARFEANTSDTALVKNAATFPFVTDGIPYVYYGQEQGFVGGQADYVNRQAMWLTGYGTDTDLYTHFTRLNAARSAAGNTSSSFYTTKATTTVSGSNEIVISKGNMYSILSNRGASSGNVSVSMSNTGYSASTELLDIVTCTTLTTGSDGSISAVLVSGAPQVYVPSSYNANNTICSSTSGATTSTTTSSAINVGVPILMGSLFLILGSWIIAV